VQYNQDSDDSFVNFIMAEVLAMPSPQKEVAKQKAKDPRHSVC
jgi:hypothetical protein